MNLRVGSRRRKPRARILRMSPVSAVESKQGRDQLRVTTVSQRRAVVVANRDGHRNALGIVPRVDRERLAREHNPSKLSSEAPTALASPSSSRSMTSRSTIPYVASPCRIRAGKPAPFAIAGLERLLRSPHSRFVGAFGDEPAGQQDGRRRKSHAEIAPERA